MRSLSSRERLMLAAVVAAAIATVFYLFIWSPQTARRETLAQTLQTQLDEVKRLNQLAETREEKEREFAQLSARIQQVEAKLPAEREIPQFLRQLQDVATSLGIKLTLLRPGPMQAGPTASPATPGQPTAGGPGVAAAAAAPGAPPQAPRPRYQLFRVDMSFDGTYNDLVSFMGRLEDFPRFLVLTGFSVAPGELPRLKVTMNGNTFVLPREAASPPR